MVKIGVIGLGVGEAHIQAYNNNTNCEVIALCDFNKSKLDEIKNKYPNRKLYYNALDLIHDKEIDAISIASFDNFHYEQIIEALRHDKHIFVEKPVVNKPEHASKVVEFLSKKPDLVFTSNLILRQYPRFKKLNELIKMGTLGQIYSFEGDYNYGRLNKITDGWRGKQDYSTVLGGGIHLVDLILWLAESKVKKVHAYGNNFSTKNINFSDHDFVNSFLTFDNGLVAKVSINLGSFGPHFHNFKAYGTNGSFYHDNLNPPYYYTSRDPNHDRVIINEPYPGVSKGAGIDNFINAIISNENLFISRNEIFDAISVCFAINESSKSGSTVNVKYFEECQN